MIRGSMKNRKPLLKPGTLNVHKFYLCARCSFDATRPCFWRPPLLSSEHQIRDKSKHLTESNGRSGSKKRKILSRVFLVHRSIKRPRPCLYYDIGRKNNALLRFCQEFQIGNETHCDARYNSETTTNWELKGVSPRNSVRRRGRENWGNPQAIYDGWECKNVISCFVLLYVTDWYLSKNLNTLESESEFRVDIFSSSRLHSDPMGQSNGIESHHWSFRL